MSATFRFGVNLFGADSRADWVEKCRRAEELDYDVLSIPDHLGWSGPIASMLSAAAATERVRVTSHVLNAAFYTPALLAREVAGLDVLSDGRIELGLGAGYVRAEFEAAGLAFPSARRRVDHVADTAATLRRLYADPEYRPRPVQSGGPPLLIGGWGDRMLRVAADHADIVALTGAAADESGHLTLATADAFDERVARLRGLLGARADEVECNTLIQVVASSAERATVREALAEHLPAAADGLEDVPTILIGSPDEIAELVWAQRRRYGFTYFTVQEWAMETFAPVIERLR